MSRKPFDPDELALRVERLSAGSSSPQLAGQIESQPYWELLEALQLARRSGRLELYDLQREAWLELHLGGIESAAYGKLRFREAALALAAEARGGFGFTVAGPDAIETSAGVEISVDDLRLESAFLDEELRARRRFVPASKTLLHAVPGALPPLPERYDAIPVAATYLRILEQGDVSLEKLEDALAVAPRKIHLAVAWLLEQGSVTVAGSPVPGIESPAAGRATEPVRDSAERPSPLAADAEMSPRSRSQASSAGTVVVVDPDAERRRALAQGLARRGYEVAPAQDLEQGAQYLGVLRPQVVVLPLAALDDPQLAEHLGEKGGGERTIVAFGAAEEEGSAPRRVVFLSTGGLAPESFVDRMRLVLLGRELDLEPDAEVSCLLGQLSRRSLFELLPELGASRFGGVLELAGGRLHLADGRPVAAEAGNVRGLKAFCRLVTATEGTFRLLPADDPPDPEWKQGLEVLMALALEDSMRELPDPRTRVRVEIGPKLFATRFSPLQQQLLEAARDGISLGRLLDLASEPDGRVLHEILELESLGVLVLSEPEAAVAVITDSCCDLPRELMRSLGVEVVPLTVTFGRQVFHDGVDLTPAAFFDRLASDPDHPFTNPPPRAAFADSYADVLERKDVVSLHISEKLSQTVVHAREAAADAQLAPAARRDDGEPPRLEVIDTRQASLPQGMLVVYAARMAERGLPASEIGERVRAMRERIHSFFVVDTLEYLVRGNRIGRARALIGTLLGIKPILGVEDGEVVALDRVRGGRNAHRRILELAGERLDRERPVMAGIAHAKAPVWGESLRALFSDSFEVREMVVGEMGPVIGTHVGPGTVGIAIFQPDDDELELIAPAEQSL